MTQRCRHRRHWLYKFEHNQLLWCYECGAIQDGIGSRWVKPVGKDGDNPAIRRFNLEGTPLDRRRS